MYTKQTRELLGLETDNSAEFVSVGVVVRNSNITEKKATKWGRFSGGGDELEIKNPEAKIKLNAVIMPDNPIPFGRISNKDKE